MSIPEREITATTTGPPPAVATKPALTLLSEPSTRPHPARTAMRVAGETALFVRHLPVMRTHAHDHDGQPVLVLPGFLASDTLTLGLRHVLTERGFRTHGWKLGVNVGPTDRILANMRRRLDRLTEVHGQPVSIVGWSLGGLYARQLARERPEAVRQVITLGSPINLTVNDTHTTAVHAVFQRLQRFFSSELADLGRAEIEKDPLEVPATSVYTAHDEIVPWYTCIDSTGAPHHTENIEVRGTHVGLPHNRAVVHALLDRLALPHGQWSHFEPPADHVHHYPLHAQRANRATSLGR